MENPRHWRLNKQRYGNGEGGLNGTVCPRCGTKLFGREGGVCPVCSLKPGEKNKETTRKNSLGVGALIFVDTLQGLKLLIFNQTGDNYSDNGERGKRERVAGQGAFEIPSGANTVTGKVDGVTVADFPELANGEVSDNLKTVLVEAIIREITEEAGITLSSEQVHYFTSSSMEVEQIRENGQETVLHNFKIFPFVAVIDEEQLKAVARDFSLINPDDELIKDLKLRIATQAIMEFKNIALLFIKQAVDNFASVKRGDLSES